MHTKYPFDQSVLVAGLVLLLLIALGCLSLMGIGNLVETSHWVEHTQIVIDRLQTLLTDVEEEAMAKRSFVRTGDSAYLQSYQTIRQDVLAQFQNFQDLTSDNQAPNHQKNSARLEDLLTQNMAAVERIGPAGESVQLPALTRQIEESDRLIGQIKDQITAMQADERRLLQQRSANSQQSAVALTSIIVAGTFIGLMVLLGNTFILRREMAMRGRAEETLRQSEEQMRLMIDSVKDYAVIMLDPGGNVVGWNSGAERIKGWRAEEIIGRHFSCFYPEDKIREKFPEKELKEAAAKGRFEDEGWRMRKDGSRFWANVVVSAIRNPRGQLLGFVKFTRDVTARKEAEGRIQKLNEELKQRADDLETANKELESFSYSVSHDLRAPLRHIHGFVELLEKAPSVQGDEASRHQMSVISKAAKEMGRLIDDLLAFSRTGRVEMHPIPIDMRKMVDQIIRECETEYTGRRVTWDIKPLPRVAGDPNLLRLVWTNLLDNALKYTRPRDEAKIEIGQIADDGNGSARREAVFYVRDNGVGFDMCYAAKLFEVFQRLHRAEDFEGTGIGLANVQRIIHRHGGRVWAESQVDLGATFYFSLPIIQPV